MAQATAQPAHRPGTLLSPPPRSRWRGPAGSTGAEYPAFDPVEDQLEARLESIDLGPGPQVLRQRGELGYGLDRRLGDRVFESLRLRERDGAEGMPQHVVVDRPGQDPHFVGLQRQARHPAGDLLGLFLTGGAEA